MTELYINEKPVILSEDLSFDFFQKNMFFTQTGDYSYDIDIDLNIPQNAVLYSHIQRTHSENYPTGRIVSLYSDGLIQIKGEEILLSVEDNVAKIQIVSTSLFISEIYSEKKIRDMDLGVIPEVNADIAYNTLSLHYPESDFVCPVIGNETGYYNQCSMYPSVSNGIDTFNYLSDTTFVAQPYLIALMERLIKAMGYEIGYNVLLNDELARRIVMTNGVETLKFAEMMPDITVGEFITYFESFFSVVVSVNLSEQNVTIHRAYEYFQASGITIIQDKNVLIPIDKKVKDSTETSNDYRNVGYKGVSSYQNIDREILARCAIQEVASYEELVAIDKEKEYDKMIIYKVLSTDEQFVINKIEGSSSNYRFYYFLQANQFQSVYTTESDSIKELDIIPTETKTFYKLLSDITYDHSTYIPVPYAGKSGVNNPEYKLNEMIKNGLPQEIINEKIEISIYDGLKLLGSATNSFKIQFPICLRTPYWYYHAAASLPAGAVLNEKREKVFDDYLTLSLQGKNGLYQRYYSYVENSDESKYHVVRFTTKEKLDVRSIFLINHKKYYCRSLKYVITAQGIDPIVEGEFFPIE